MCGNGVIGESGGLLSINCSFVPSSAPVFFLFLFNCFLEEVEESVPLALEQYFLVLCL